MLLRQAELEAIRTGDIDLAFRRWERPRLRAGTKMRTAIGLVEVTAVQPIAARRDHRRRRAPRGRTVARGAARAPGEEATPSAPSTASACASPAPTRASRCARTPTSPTTSSRRSPPGCTASTAPATSRGRTRRSTLIERRPETKAAELAADTHRELPAFKRDVRKLKELGLTESLERGYRLSPRGRAVLDRLGPRRSP